MNVRATKQCDLHWLSDFTAKISLQTENDLSSKFIGSVLRFIKYNSLFSLFQAPVGPKRSVLIRSDL
jgi:hypothetical protein